MTSFSRSTPVAKIKKDYFFYFFLSSKSVKMLRLLSCFLLILSTQCFQVIPNTHPSLARSITSQLPRNQSSIIPPSVIATQTTTSRLTLKNKEDDGKPEKNSPMQLFFIYLNPFLNPNSIFVYMFSIVYFLGKYSESKHIVESTGSL